MIMPFADPVFVFGENIHHGKRKGITCGGIHYRTAKALEDETRRKVIDSYRNHEPFSRDDLQFVANLLALAADGNVGRLEAGLVAGWMEPNERFPGNRSVCIQKAGDTRKICVSWRQVIYRPSAAATVRQAMRFDISDHVTGWAKLEFAKAGGSIICPITRSPVRPGACEVDHMEPTFQELVDSFVAEHVPGGIDSIGVMDSTEDQTTITLKDPATREAWVEYHNRLARLQILSIHGHWMVTRDRRKAKAEPEEATQ